MNRALLVAAFLIPVLSFADGGKNLEVKIKDGEMHCDECAQTVTAALKKIPNVDQGSVKVVIEKNKAMLHVNGESTATVGQIKTALKDAGYDVTGVTEVASADAKTTTKAIDKATDKKTN